MQDLSFTRFRSLYLHDAFALATALDAYEAACSHLVENCREAELLAEVGRQLDVIRERGLRVPELMVLTLKLVIADADLVCALWRHTCLDVPAEVMQDVLAGHAAAIRALRAAALRLQTSE